MIQSDNDLVILGGGGFAREVLWLLQTAREPRGVVGFIDERPEAAGRVLCDRPVLGGFEWFRGRGSVPQVICGVGSNPVRRKFVGLARELGLSFPPAVVADAANCSEYVELGEGTLVCAGSTLTTQVRVGDHVNINLHCTLGHDVVIESFCNLSPGVHLSGYVHLEEDVDIGTNVAVIPGKRIGRGSVIGAGAVVTTDIPPFSVAVGVPARVVKTLSGDERGS